MYRRFSRRLSYNRTLSMYPSSNHPTPFPLHPNTTPTLYSYALKSRDQSMPEKGDTAAGV